MRTQLLLAVALVAPHLDTHAQALRPNTRAVIPPPIIRVDPTRVAESLARADAARHEGRAREARKIYQTLIAEQREAREFPGVAMWQLALNYLYADDKHRAAIQLDELAEAAAQFGDPTLQLRATFEAAVLWRDLKRPELVGPRVARAQALLQSPAIPESEKEFFRQRIR
jgi:hypothetical protein